MPSRCFLLLVCLALAEADNTTGAPEDSTDTETVVVVVGAIGGLLILCVLLVFLVRLLFGEMIDVELCEVDVGRVAPPAENRRKVAEMKTDHPEFTVVELEKALEKNGWDKNAVKKMIVTGSIVPSVTPRRRAPPETPDDKGWKLAELRRLNPRYTSDELLLFLKASQWDLQAAQHRINEAPRAQFRSPRSRASTVRPTRVRLPPLGTTSLGSSFSNGIRQPSSSSSPRTPRTPRTPTTPRPRVDNSF
eukprot:TRINITY_DN6519_c0_g6_i2.p1 TRINITY_DN6519_c0_g6~~TRINITY_DN6519_c0_g6_i2.p1  ORF type:complete len:248 (+),score=31.46 TRINITY_DN6519_c0_g6_i2:273-1016(+)